MPGRPEGWVGSTDQRIRDVQQRAEHLCRDPMYAQDTIKRETFIAATSTVLVSR